MIFKRIFQMIVLVVAVLGVIGTLYFRAQYEAIKMNPNIEAQKQVADLVEQVGKLMVLPSNETPTVEVISDISALADQPFFALAQNGDAVLIYNTALKAILYRPSTNKIINVGPISTHQTSGNNAATSSNPTNAPRISYYNGTVSGSAAILLEKAVHDSYPDFVTSTVANAARRNYTKTIVVDISDSYGQDASLIAALLHAQVSALPAGEVAPADTDILVIAGK